MNCKIISPNKREEFKDVVSVVLPAFSGEMEVLPGHAESFIKLRPGEVIIRSSAKEETVLVSESVCYIADDYMAIIL